LWPTAWSSFSRAGDDRARNLAAPDPFIPLVSLTWTLGVFGSAYGALLALSFAMARRRWTASDALFVAFLGNAVAAASLIAWSHRAGGTPLLDAAEKSLTLLAGPLLLRFTRGVIRRIDALHALPALALWWMPMELVVAHQIAYTLLSCRAYRARPKQPWTLLLLAFMGCIHLGQLARFVLPSTPTTRDIVPLLIGLTFVAVGMLGWHRYHARDAAPKYRKASLGVDGAHEIVARATEVLAGRSLYRDPALSLAVLAAAAGVSPHHLSQALNEAVKTTFNDLVAAHRVAYAARRLAEPASRQLTIEAVALEAGFPSRSSFYDAFRRIKGMTPTAWRQQNA
jgi:AraC-like DNA-binding protein